MACIGGVTKIAVATLGVVFPTLCVMPFWGFFCEKMAFLRRHEWCRDAVRLFPNVVYNGIRKLICCKCDVSRSDLSKRRRDSQRRFSDIASNDILTFICLTNGGLWRRHGNCRRFLNVFSIGIGYIPAIRVASSGNLATISVVSTSCPIACLRPTVPRITICVTTLGAGFPYSCRMTSGSSPIQMIVASRRSS